MYLPENQSRSGSSRSRESRSFLQTPPLRLPKHPQAPSRKHRAYLHTTTQVSAFILNKNPKTDDRVSLWRLLSLFRRVCRYILNFGNSEWKLHRLYFHLYHKRGRLTLSPCFGTWQSKKGLSWVAHVGAACLLYVRNRIPRDFWSIIFAIGAAGDRWSWRPYFMRSCQVAEAFNCCVLSSSFCFFYFSFVRVVVVRIRPSNFYLSRLCELNQYAFQEAVDYDFFSFSRVRRSKWRIFPLGQAALRNVYSFFGMFVYQGNRIIMRSLFL